MILPTLSIFSSDDPLLGRVDAVSLSQQTMMELFVQGITNKEKIVAAGSNDFQGDYKDISEWIGVYLLKQPNEVSDIRWGYCKLEGSVDLHWVPPTVEDLSLSGNALRGSVNLTVLPDSLGKVSISECKLTGTISLESLPKKLDSLNLSDNQLEGSLHLTRLPNTLTTLYLAKNAFSGTVDLTQLPPNMDTLGLDNNHLVGSTDFSKLPKSIFYLDVSHTQLSGVFVQPKGDGLRFLVRFRCKGTSITVDSGIRAGVRSVASQ